MDISNNVFRIGKFKGKTFKAVSKCEPNYSKWILSLPNVTGQLAEYKKYILSKNENVSNSNDSKRQNTDCTSPVSQKIAKIDSTNNLIDDNQSNNTLENNNLINDQVIKRINIEGTISFEIVDDDNFKLLHKKNHYNNHIPYQVYITLERFNPVILLRNNEKLLTFKFSLYNEVLDHLQQNFIFESRIEELPGFVRRAFPHFCEKTRLKPYNLLYETTIDTEIIRSRIGSLLYDSLRSFQIEGVEFGISRAGKLILGDEMGLGKTLQALGIAAYYHTDWPLLIVCPSSLRFQWKDEILNWLPHLANEYDIYTIRSSKIDLSLKYHKILIMSYDHLIRMGDCLLNYRCVICDESHFIKNKSAKRTRILMPIMKNAIRVILCSGTPSLNNPSELYHQIAPLIGKFATYNEFANSYQSIHRFSKRQIYTGCKHGDELHSFLINTIMLRRLKKNVQKELPSKLRSKIAIEISCEFREKISDLRSRIYNDRSCEINRFSELLMYTCEAKRDAVCDYVTYLIDGDHKFILFAHHLMMLDSLEECVQSYGVDYIRIDGSTNQNRREDLVKRFQTYKECRIAILSLTACGQGLNLTSASIVVMTELYWVPGLLFQAEDRAHRIGSQGVTHIHYLIAKHTLDESIWHLLSKKWKDVSNTLDGKKETIILNPDEISKNQTSILSYLIKNAE